MEDMAWIFNFILCNSYKFLLGYSFQGNESILHTEKYAMINRSTSKNPRVIFQKINSYHIIDRNRPITCINK